MFIIYVYYKYIFIIYLSFELQIIFQIYHLFSSHFIMKMFRFYITKCATFYKLSFQSWFKNISLASILYICLWNHPIITSFCFVLLFTLKSLINLEFVYMTFIIYYCVTLFYITYRYNFMYFLKCLVLFSSRWVASCNTITYHPPLSHWLELPSVIYTYHIIIYAGIHLSSVLLTCFTSPARTSYWLKHMAL